MSPSEELVQDLRENEDVNLQKATISRVSTPTELAQEFYRLSVDPTTTIGDRILGIEALGQQIQIHSANGTLHEFARHVEHLAQVTAAERRLMQDFGGIGVNVTPRPSWDRSLHTLQPISIFAVSDDDRDPDDRVAKMVLAGMVRLGARIDVVGYVANHAPSWERAAMANSAVQSLEFAPGLAVGQGSDAANDPEAKQYEYDPKFANARDLLKGDQLFQAGFERCRKGSLTLILMSALTDANDFAQNNRTLFRDRLERSFL